LKNLQELLVACLVILCGCASGLTTKHHGTRVVERPADPEWAVEAAHDLEGNNVQVDLWNEQGYEGEILALNAEQITLRDNSSGTELVIPMDSVLRINSGSNARWVVLGAVVGGILGGLGGVEAGIALAPEEKGFENLGQGILSLTLGGAIGAVAGVYFGKSILDAATFTPSYVLLDKPGQPEVPAVEKDD